MYRRTWMALAGVAAMAALAACDAPRPTEQAAPPSLSRKGGGHETDSIVREVRLLAAERGIGRLPTPPRVRQPLVRLGRALAFDPILSGTRDMMMRRAT